MNPETAEILMRAREAARTGTRLDARAVCHHANRPDLAGRREFADTPLDALVGATDPPDEEVS